MDVSKSWNPLQDLMLLQDRMNRLFEEATERRSHVDNEADQTEAADWYPLADVYNNDGKYLIAIDLPGVDRSTLEISIDSAQLIVKGARTLNDTSSSSAERPFGRFLRTFSVPGTIERQEIQADYKDGVLEIQLPKRKEPKAKRIEIKVS